MRRLTAVCAERVVATDARADPRHTVLVLSGTVAVSGAVTEEFTSCATSQYYTALNLLYNITALHYT